MRSERRDADYWPDMPSAEGADYLLGYLWEVGPTLVAGMGAGPITHQELRAWQVNSGIRLQPWEARILRRLSIDYLAEMSRAEKADCPAPWQSVAVTVDRAVVANKMLHAIRALAGR
jgi:hypothetical protein